jgi:hypothetical protein
MIAGRVVQSMELNVPRFFENFILYSQLLKADN